MITKIFSLIFCRKTNPKKYPVLPHFPLHYAFSSIIRAQSSKKGTVLKTFSSRSSFEIIRQLMCTCINQRASWSYQIRICKIANVLSDWSWVNVCKKEQKLDKAAKLDREGVYFYCAFIVAVSGWTDSSIHSEKR